MDNNGNQSSLVQSCKDGTIEAEYTREENSAVIRKYVVLCSFSEVASN